jgi:hypothetical protein
VKCGSEDGHGYAKDDIQIGRYRVT